MNVKNIIRWICSVIFAVILFFIVGAFAVIIFHAQDSQGLRRGVIEFFVTQWSSIPAIALGVQIAPKEHWKKALIIFSSLSVAPIFYDIQLDFDLAGNVAGSIVAIVIVFLMIRKHYQPSDKNSKSVNEGGILAGAIGFMLLTAVALTWLNETDPNGKFMSMTSDAKVRFNGSLLALGVIVAAIGGSTYFVRNWISKSRINRIAWTICIIVAVVILCSMITGYLLGGLANMHPIVSESH